MVAGHDEHVGVELADARQHGVHLLDLLHLGREVPVLAAAVGVLVVHEEEVIFRPVAVQRGDLLFESPPRVQHVHAHQLGHAPVHGIDGDGPGPQIEHVRELGEAGILGEAAQVEGVGRVLVGEQRPRLAQPVVDQRGRVNGFRAVVQRLHGQRGPAHHQGVGLAQGGGKARAAQDEQVAVFLHRLHEQLVPCQGRARLQPGRQPGAHLGGDAAGAAVGDQTLLVHGAEVAPRRQIVGPQVEADAQGLQDTAADVVDERVVAEEGQVRRAAAGGYAASDGQAEAARALGGQPVQVWGMGGFQFRRAARLDGQSAQAIHDQEHDLARPRLRQPAHQVEICHAVHAPCVIEVAAPPPLRKGDRPVSQPIPLLIKRDADAAAVTP